ncbi:unnamed protein product [Strongylus vulgaris]|uniref:Uncharacterized protein n=1 Tax=Strongylus vulgaris TaxID=40348 RepID=A0A3P7IXX8_STRVU|nr:unnamed protein product [Strongylus vulgaris]
MGWSYNEEDRRQMDTKSFNGFLEKQNVLERPPSRLTDEFVVRMDQLHSQLVTSNGSGPRERRHRTSIPTSWMTLARDRNG